MIVRMFIKILLLSLLASSTLHAQAVVLDTAKKESEYYTQAIKEIFKSNGLYVPFEGTKLKAVSRTLKRLGLKQTKRYIIDRSQTRFEEWKGEISLGPNILGNVRVTIAGCRNRSRRLHHYDFRVTELDQAEIILLMGLMEQYQNAYAYDKSRRYFAHTTTREKYITGVQPAIGQMIVASVQLKFDEPQNSVVGQYLGEMKMQCPPLY